jgi:glycerol dehydrogenase-like iron-containing ADH family enzyme
MVAIGLLIHLVLEGYLDEAERVTRFLAKLGLPVHLGHLSLYLDNDLEVLNEAMAACVEKSLFVQN